MARTGNDRDAEDNAGVTVPEHVSRLARRVEVARRGAGEAQQTAADSFDRSADSHDGAARSYEKLAECAVGRDEYLKHAAIHREFAHEDRQIAQRLRQTAESVSPAGS